MRSTSSFTLVAGTDVCATRTFGVVAAMVTGSKSLIGSYGTLPYRLRLILEGALAIIIVCPAARVLHVELLAQAFGELLRNEPRDQVAWTAGRERHDDAYRPSGVGLSRRRCVLGVAHAGAQHRDRADHPNECPHRVSSFVDHLFAAGRSRLL